MTQPKLITTLGALPAEAVQAMLPHEHVFVDLRTPETPGYAEAETSAVVALMQPELEKLKALHVSALVECTPVGVGRRADILQAVSRAANFPLVVPTGIYREPWVPSWAIAASATELEDWLLSELTGQIEQTKVHAAWIKLSANNDGMTQWEREMLRAAARAGKRTHAAIGSHTIRGRVVLEQLDEIEAQGYTASRFIAIHASAEADFGLNLAAAKRGAWIEFDWIGASPEHDAVILERTLRMLDAGFGKQILLSQDRGWFDPAQAGGGAPKPFTHLHEVFLPKLRAAGMDEGTVMMLMRDNPWRAFAR